MRWTMADQAELYQGFTSTTFIGYAKAPFKMNRSGEYEFTLAVPFDFRKAAHLLEEAMEIPVRITIDRLTEEDLVALTGDKDEDGS